MTAPALRLSLLGPPLITVDGRSLNVDRQKATALLIYLAVTALPQSRDSLATLFWPDYDQSRARANLRQALWILKKALHDAWLDIDRERVRLKAGYYLDTAVFQETISRAATSMAQEQPIDLAGLSTIVHAYRATFLDGFTLPDAPDFDTWQFFQAQNLSQQLGIALQLLLCTYQQQAAWGKAIHYAQQWVALDPLHEAAHVELMQLFVQSNQITAALRQYEQCQQILAQELGISPQPETTLLYKKLQHAPQTAKSPAEPRPAFIAALSPRLPLHEVPQPGPLPAGSRMVFRPNPHFVGRQAELKQLAQSLKVDTAVAINPILVAATGLGGIGKTQLAVEFAYRYGRFFPGGVFWINCADEAEIASEIAQCGGENGLGLAENFATLPLKKQVNHVQQQWQEPIPRLLIFDNCESEAVIAQWRPAAGGCRVLVTSRRSRWDPGLAISQCDLGILQREDSISLLCHFLPALADDAETAAAIAAELGDLPLALYLAGCFLAKYKHAISPAKYLAQLRNEALLTHPSLVGSGTDYSPTDHDIHVSRTLQLSYRQLDPQNKVDKLALNLLARAAYLAAGELMPRSLLLATIDIDPDDSDALLLAENSILRLIELGLLEEKGTGALRLHRLLAVFVHELLADDAVETAVAEGLLAVLKTRAGETNYLGNIPLLAPHLRSTVTASVSPTTPALASLNRWLAQHSMDTGNYAAAKPYLDRCLTIRQQLLGPEHPQTADVLTLLGNWHKDTGDLPTAQSFYEKALAIHQQTSGMNHVSTARCLTNMGAILNARGKRAEAKPYYEQALAIFEQTVGPFHPQTAICVNNLGVLFATMNQLEQALPYYERTLEIDKQTLGMAHPYTAMSLNNIGNVWESMGEFDKAHTNYKQALSIFKQTVGEEHPFTAQSLNALGSLLYKTNELEQAQAVFEKALFIRQKKLGPNHIQTAITMRDLGSVLQAKGDFNGALYHFTYALQVFEQNLDDDHYRTRALRQIVSDLSAKIDSSDVVLKTDDRSNNS